MAADERMLHVLIKSCPLEDGDAAAWARRLLAALREEHPSSLAASVRSIAADLRRNAQALARHEPEALARMSADEPPTARRGASLAHAHMKAIEEFICNRNEVNEGPVFLTVSHM